MTRAEKIEDINTLRLEIKTALLQKSLSNIVSFRKWLESLTDDERSKLSCDHFFADILGYLEDAESKLTNAIYLFEGET